MGEIAVPQHSAALARAERDFEDMSLDELKTSWQRGQKTAGHPQFGHARGVNGTANVSMQGESGDGAGAALPGRGY